MSKKISWKMIYKDFKQRHPNLAKKTVHYCPKDYLTIEIWLDDGAMITYDYFKSKAIILDKRWKD